MSSNRRRCFESFAQTGLRPILVTAKELDSWILPSHPLHEAYGLLSPVHRSDYLRAYFMHHYGGGYSDIKEHARSWLPTINQLAKSETYLGAGYREIRGGTVYLQHNRIDGRAFVLSRSVNPLTAAFVTNLMRTVRPLLIGNGAFFFKKQTPYTKRWLGEVERRLDLLLPSLIAHPAQQVRDSITSSSGYPIPWSFLLGDISGPLGMAYSWRLLKTLPPPSFENYL